MTFINFDSSFGQYGVILRGAAQIQMPSYASYFRKNRFCLGALQLKAIIGDSEKVEFCMFSRAAKCDFLPMMYCT